MAAVAANWVADSALTCPRCGLGDKMYIWPIWPDPRDVSRSYNTHWCSACNQYWRDEVGLVEILNHGKGGKKMFSELKTAAQKFLQDNRDMIFTVLLLFIVDTYFLNGALRNRLEGLLHKTVDKLEDKPNVVKS